LLLEDQEAARCDMGIRLFQELTELRELNERHELEKAKSALEALVEQKELLLKEVNHRVKNSLQIVSSILHLQVPHTQSTEAADALRSAAARVLAIAAVHERLYTGEDASVVRLDAFLIDLCGEIGRACGYPDGIKTDVQRVDVPTDMAIPLALIVNELVTNVVKHVGPPCAISLRPEGGNALKPTISDAGMGPPEAQLRAGLGTRIVDAFSEQLGARVETKHVAGGYTIELTVPIPPTQR
jgi:two-component sensor histidine kinase